MLQHHALNSAIVLAARNEMDAAISIAVGSSTQIALFVGPALMLLSFVIAPRPMDLLFSVFELVAIAVCSAMPEGSCLPQSLVTARLLKREGHRASLVIGTKAARGQAAGKHVVPFSAHAWVEVPPPEASDPPIVFHRGDHEELVRFSKSA